MKHALCAAAMLVIGCATAHSADVTPDGFITEMYNRIRSNEAAVAAGKPDFSPLNPRELSAYFSKRAIDNLKAAQKKDPAVIDVDPFTDSQDPDISLVVIKRLKVEKCAAKIEATVTNYDKPVRVVFDMVQTKAGWRISDIDTSGRFFSAFGRKAPLPPEKAGC